MSMSLENHRILREPLKYGNFVKLAGWWNGGCYVFEDLDLGEIIFCGPMIQQMYVGLHKVSRVSRSRVRCWQLIMSPGHVARHRQPPGNGSFGFN